MNYYRAAKTNGRGHHYVALISGQLNINGLADCEKQWRISQKKGGNLASEQSKGKIE
jgi:hypothetical protein